MLDLVYIVIGAVFLGACVLYATPATVCEATAMSVDYVLGAIVTIGLLVYLVYALVRPEKF
jgi:K+-transporting ATPase KdpF subunit